MTARYATVEQLHLWQAVVSFQCGGAHGSPGVVEDGQELPESCSGLDPNSSLALQTALDVLGKGACWLSAAEL